MVRVSVRIGMYMDGGKRMNIKEYFEEKNQLRCPFCNINDAPPIDDVEWEEEYKEGFRYYCEICEKCFSEPVIDLSDVEKMVEKYNEHRNKI